MPVSSRVRVVLHQGFPTARHTMSMTELADFRLEARTVFWATRAGAGTPRPQGRAVYAFEDEDGNGGSGHVCAKAKKCELCEVK